ncbi:hypothetical protein QI210_10390 [Staphylococcus saprophyticus]|nr:hypothetical protein [Staphylococcus saprophyticus]
MMFSKAQLYYINPMYYLYIYLRMRDTVQSVWYGIRNILENMPIKYRNQLLKEEEK